MMNKRTLILFALASFAPAMTPLSGPALAQDETITVYAAASLQNVLKDIGSIYTKQTGKSVVFSFAGSSVLARQLEQGAPADLFISADVQWMDYVQGKGLVRTASRLNLLTNHLALIAPKDSTLKLKIAPGFPLAAALGDGRLAMADPAAVPAGLYGKAALAKLGVWPSVEGKVAKGENVRAALIFVAKGEAPLGIVYDTDAKVDPSVRIVDLFPEDSHPPILYPAAVTTNAKGPGAAAFLAYLQTPTARAVFEKYGFRRPGL